MKKIFVTLLYFIIVCGNIQLNSMQISYNNFITSVPNTTSDNYRVNMSLHKYSYKKFEPVLAKFEIINDDNKALNISNTLFNPVLNEAQILITDNLGNKWTTNKQPT